MFFLRRFISLRIGHKTSKKIDVIISPRASKNGAGMLAMGMTTEEAINATFGASLIQPISTNTVHLDYALFFDSVTEGSSHIFTLHLQF